MKQVWVLEIYVADHQGKFHWRPWGAYFKKHIAIQFKRELVDRDRGEKARVVKFTRAG